MNVLTFLKQYSINSISSTVFHQKYILIFFKILHISSVDDKAEKNEAVSVTSLLLPGFMKKEKAPAFKND